MKGITSTTIIIAFGIIPAAVGFSQYSLEWTSPNLGPAGWGGAYGFDIDNDNRIEIEARSTTQIIFYNGSYTSDWTISFPGYSYLNVLHPRDTNGDGRMVPLNTDNDAAGEVVVTGYYYSNPNYYGRFRVYDATSHALEYESPLITGFYGSGTLEDIDGDGRDEIILVHNGGSSSESYIIVYAYTAGTGEKSGGYEVRSVPAARPNPATGTVTIPFLVAESQAREKLRAAIYDAGGRIVTTLLENERAAPGDYRLIWNGSDDHGNRAAPGSYFFKLTIGEKNTVRKIELVH